MPRKAEKKKKAIYIYIYSYKAICCHYVAKITAVTGIAIDSLRSHEVYRALERKTAWSLTRDCL